MDTQYILLVWVCCLTPLFPVFCCRNKDEFRTAAGLGEGTLHKRDILSGEVKDNWSPKQSSTGCDFQRPSGASRKCQYHPQFHLSNSELGESSSEWWNSFTTVLTVKVFPLLTNLFCWLVIFWIFNLSPTTSTGNLQHQLANQKHRKTPSFKKSGGRPINLTDQMFACSLAESPNRKRMHPGTSFVCTRTVVPQSEEHISEKDNTFNVAFTETCQPSTAKFSVTGQSDCTMQESRDLVPTAILQDTMEGMQLSHPSLVYNRSSDGDKIKKRDKLFTQSLSTKYTTEDDDISELSTEDMEVAFLTRLNKMATETANRQIHNMTQRGEDSQKKKARDVRQLSTCNKCIEFSALGTPSKPQLRKMSSHQTQEMSNQPSHLLKRKSIVQENTSGCPLPFPKDRSETGGKTELIREPDCVEVKSKMNYSTMHAYEISRAKKDGIGKQRENLEGTPSASGRNRHCCQEPIKSAPNIAFIPYISYEGNCSETKRLASSFEDPRDSYRRQLLRNRSFPIDRHKDMAKGLLQLGDASEAEQLSLRRRHPTAKVASEPRLPCAQMVREGLECPVLPDDATRQLRHERYELTDSPPRFCVDNIDIGENRFPDNSSDKWKKISSNISRFQTFCQRLLETSSFEETDDVEHFNPNVTMASCLDEEHERLISPFQDGTTTEAVFLTETIRDDECLETLSSSMEQPWSAMCLGDPEGKLENVPVFYNHLVSSCIETERAKKDVALGGAYIITGGLSSKSEKANELSTPLEDENLGCVPEHLCQSSSSSNTVTEYPLESQRDDDQAKGIPRSKGTSKPLEVPMDIDFVYTSSKSGRLVPVKDFIKILESCYLGIEEKKKIVSEQYSIAREKCCLDWIEAIRNRGRRILPKWWLHRYMRVEGLESNKCRKRREWLERKQVQALEEERLREKKDLHFLGARSDIARYLDEPSGPEKLLFEYDKRGIPTFQVEDYFKAIFDKYDAPGLSAENKVNLNQGMPSRWTSPPLVMSVELSAEKCVRNPNHNNSAAGEPRENPGSRKVDMKQVNESPPVDRAKEDGSGDSLCES